MMDVDWAESGANAFFNLYALVSFTQSVPGIIYIVLSFTPALWSAYSLQIIGLMWDGIAISSGMPPGALTDVFEAYGAFNKTSCMNRTEVAVAISSPDANVSGWYGPGAYLAWLITAWCVAISSIASAKLASKNPKRLELDPELIAVVFYPLVAAMDIIVRLIRCKIDASMTAANFVVVTALCVLSPMKRLSIQQDGSELLQLPGDDESFFESKRAWTVRIPRWIFHGILSSVIGQAYSNHRAVAALWVLLFVTLLYSGLVGNYSTFKGHYRQPFRPWQERVIFFIAVQIIFSVVLLTTGSRSFWPQTSASLFDLDQVAGLVAALIALIFFKAKPLMAFLRKAYKRESSGQVEEEVPLMNVSRPSGASTPRSVRRAVTGDEV